MKPTDHYAIQTAKSAISAALDGLRTAYKASTDYRAEDRISGLIDALEEGHADLCVIALEIEDDANNEGDPYTNLRDWYPVYRAA